ncbi:aldo/keto reductase [Pseudoduganella sp. UC29_106]|uniref:aldo/keto reductase n=1 Tax=Pseudoduganella sp. UC29_106 TaxID=3374553 RepID=UPI0037568331
MYLCHAYIELVSAPEVERPWLAALDLGVTHFDTAALYGFGASETMVGRVLSKHRSRFTLASKCGMDCIAGPGGVKRPRNRWPSRSDPPHL